jgi:hypothetical protein
MRDDIKRVARSRTYTWEDPMLSAEAGRRMSGVEYLRAIRDGGVPAPPFALTMGMRLAEFDEGRAVFECEPAEYHYNRCMNLLLSSILSRTGAERSAAGVTIAGRRS